MRIVQQEVWKRCVVSCKCARRLSSLLKNFSFRVDCNMTGETFFIFCMPFNTADSAIWGETIDSSAPSWTWRLAIRDALPSMKCTSRDDLIFSYSVNMWLIALSSNFAILPSFCCTCERVFLAGSVAAHLSYNCCRSVFFVLRIRLAITKEMTYFLSLL